MSLGDCADCLKLYQDITITSTGHMAAMSRHAVAVQNGADEAEIAALEGAIHLRAMERQEAFDRYRVHLLKHAPKASGTATGQA